MMSSNPISTLPISDHLQYAVGIMLTNNEVPRDDVMAFKHFDVSDIEFTLESSVYKLIFCMTCS
jgi:hypothetical protein